MVDLPHQIGPCQLVELGALVAIRVRPISMACCVGQGWEQLVPRLRRSTDPLFRRAGLNLDHE
jgi:hypothetical protein